MFKIFLISCVGVACASYPKNDPLLNRDALRHFSRLNTFVLSPALVIYSLGEVYHRILFIAIKHNLPVTVNSVLYIMHDIHNTSTICM